MRLSRGMCRLWLVCALAPVLALAQPQKSDLQGYQDGRTALDNLQWQKAIGSFQGLSAGSAQAEGALYWKAFALYMQGQGREALASIAELRKSFRSEERRVGFEG